MISFRVEARLGSANSRDELHKPLGGMMRNSDLEYFRRRAVQERTLAVTATSDDAAAVHTELAERYEALANGQSLYLASDRVPA